MHTGEMWQDYSLSGVPLESGGYDSSLGNPDTDFEMVVGSANVWFYRFTPAGDVEILFQHRSEKVNNGGKWDVSAAGHMNYGETIAEAAIRESREEIGAEVVVEDLKYIFTLRSDTKNLMNHYFLCDWTGHEEDFHFDDEEVSEVKWISLDDFDEFFEENIKEPVKRQGFVKKLTLAWLRRIKDGDPEPKE